MLVSFPARLIVAMHFAAAVQVLLRLKFSRQGTADS